MEETPRSKRRRVHSVEPNAVMYTTFTQKYICYLLPALLEASSARFYGGNKDSEIEKKVRFEVKMALVLSAGEFRWSHTLKHELERGKNTRKLHRSTPMGALLTYKGSRHFGIAEELERFRSLPTIPRPLALGEATKPKGVRGIVRCSEKMLRGDDELGFHVRALRRILPGGSEMGVCELLSEVESYVVCLQMQVNILRSLVAAH